MLQHGKIRFIHVKHDKKTLSLSRLTHSVDKKQAGVSVLSKSRGFHSLTHASLGIGTGVFSRTFIAHDIQGALYSCSGLTSHTVREELSAS